MDRNGQGETENAEWTQAYIHKFFSLVNNICVQTIEIFNKNNLKRFQLVNGKKTGTQD